MLKPIIMQHQRVDCHFFQRDRLSICVQAAVQKYLRSMTEEFFKTLRVVLLFGSFWYKKEVISLKSICAESVSVFTKDFCHWRN